MKTASYLVAVLAVSALLAGCYKESGDVTLHNPGVYKGDSDPLLKSDAKSRDATLADRFNLVQVDR